LLQTNRPQHKEASTIPGEAHPSTPAAQSAHRTLMIPKRKRTRTQSRADRIRAERALNDDYVAKRNAPPPF
jgi:hypothetical protein